MLVFPGSANVTLPLESSSLRELPLRVVRLLQLLPCPPPPPVVPLNRLPKTYGLAGSPWRKPRRTWSPTSGINTKPRLPLHHYCYRHQVSSHAPNLSAYHPFASSCVHSDKFTDESGRSIILVLSDKYLQYVQQGF